MGDAKLRGAQKYKSLFSKVKYVMDRTPDIAVVIDPDINIPFQDIISTLNVCRRVENVRGGKPIEVKFAAKAIEEKK